MLKKIRIALILSLFAITPVFASSVITSAANFTEVQQILQQVPHPHHTLLALDDDDTLTMMPCPSPDNCQYLGGPAWFAWQSKLSANNPNRVWTTFSELLNINNVIFAMSAMPLTDMAIPAALQTAQDRGIKIVAATARGYDMSNATERQLSDDAILPIIEKNALKAPDGNISFAGDYMPSPWNASAPLRPIAYTNGILYLSGQNKGEMLKQFIAKAGKTNAISEIVFVDDTNQNVIDVANAYKDDPNVNVISVHFTEMQAHKAAFLTGPNAKKLQAIANNRWYAIRTILRKQLPGFTL